MSTEIKGHFGDERHVVLNHRGDVVFIFLPHATNYVKDSAINRADFLKAVADELDVIVVERSELPEVTREGRWLTVGGADRYETDFDHHEAALRNLALAEYLDANPPTDPKVEALTEVIRQMPEADALNAGALAEALIATGRVEVTP